MEARQYLSVLFSLFGVGCGIVGTCEEQPRNDGLRRQPASGTFYNIQTDIRLDMASASAKKASKYAAAEKALLDEIKQLVDPVTGRRSKAPDAVNELHSALYPRLVDLESAQVLAHAPRPPTVDRALALSRLEDWLRIEAPQSMLGYSFRIALVGADGAQGATLVAVRDLSPGELFVRVPRSAIMSADSAMESRFGMFAMFLLESMAVLIYIYIHRFSLINLPEPQFLVFSSFIYLFIYFFAASFFARDPLCQQNLSVMLALHVVFERRDPASKWRAYLDALPDDSWGRSFLPAFVSPAQLDALEGTGVRGAAQALLRACVQQYVYLRLVLDEATKANASKPAAAAGAVAPNSTDAPLTWSEWRWALSIVWSRQNRIPAAAAAAAAASSAASAAGDAPPAQSFCMALVPAWDFCNHSPEACATDACPLAGAAFDLELDCLECRCPPAGVRAGEAISMYYGARSSAHFLLYQVCLRMIRWTL